MAWDFLLPDKAVEFKACEPCVFFSRWTVVVEWYYWEVCCFFPWTCWPNIPNQVQLVFLSLQFSFHLASFFISTVIFPSIFYINC
ncbi:hypothetical protein Cni_G28347 [Canna indica]|uniref:Uncharacterized protein n=1 Tax=Canna indica TaxID=4628 RepID=A0AAQ3QT19_9LILI|nr:hypothetical protein Cni_G28347 [Canna indica]